MLTTSADTSRADKWVPWLLLFGGLLVGVGWIAGVALLWASDTWSTRDKVMATVLFPFGLALAAFTLGMTLTYGTSGSCTGSGSSQLCITKVQDPLSLLVWMVILVAVPVLVAIHLERVRRGT